MGNIVDTEGTIVSKLRKVYSLWGLTVLSADHRQYVGKYYTL